MKRQVAIVGDTPEFLRWSVRMDCPLRQGTDLDSIDQTEKRLRAVRGLGLAIGQQRIHDGIAIQKFDKQWKGFRVDEVTAFWNGLPPIEQACGNCSANILCEPNRHGSLAGCHGWLPRRLDQDDDARPALDIGNQLESILTQECRQRAAELFLKTEPIWYGVWASGQLSGDALSWTRQQFAQLAESAPALPALSDFAKVLQICDEQEMLVDVELIPAGNSDGLHWRIAVHCDQCKWPFEEGQRYCRCCKKPGQGHPMIKKRVLGLRPYVDLKVLLGDQENPFCDKWKLE